MSQQHNANADLTKVNIITGIVLVLFTVAVIIWLIPGFVEEPSGYEETGLSPRFFPYLSAIALSVLSVILIIENLIKLKDQAQISAVEESEENEVLAFGKTEIGNCAIFLVGSLVYKIMLEHTGFIISSTFLLGIMMFFSRIRLRVLIPISILLPVIISQILWLALEFPLP